MGDEAEALFDRYLDSIELTDELMACDLIDKFNHQHHNVWWTTRAGRRVRVIHMKDSHLLNTIDMLEQNPQPNMPKLNQSWITVLRAEMKRRSYAKR